MISAEAYFQEVITTLSSICCREVGAVVDLLDDVRLSGGSLYTCGNGGSAGHAVHFACDIQKIAYLPPQRRLRTIALPANLALVTAYGNDDGYDRSMAGQLEGLLSPADAVMGISTSGRSPNIVAALDYARQAGARTVAIVGAEGWPMRRLADVEVVVPTAAIQVMEDCQLSILHAVSVLLRARLEASAGRLEGSTQPRASADGNGCCPILA